jgi:hypothetical protein
MDSSIPGPLRNVQTCAWTSFDTFKGSVRSESKVPRLDRDPGVQAFLYYCSSPIWTSGGSFCKVHEAEANAIVEKMFVPPGVRRARLRAEFLAILRPFS